MGSQTTVLQRLRRLLAKRGSEEDTHESSTSNGALQGSSKRSHPDTENTNNVQSKSSVSSLAEPHRTNSVTNTTDASAVSLASRRAVSFGSTASPDAGPDSMRGGATNTSSNSGNTNVPSGNANSPGSNLSNLNGNGVRMDPKVLLLRSKPNDAASILTIASSSKRRRSLDTNASTRALAAESIFSSDTVSIASNHH